MNKEQLSSYDIYKWVSENSQFFIGGFIQNVYQIDEKFIFRIYSKEFGKKDFFIDFSGAVYFGEKPDTQVTDFAKRLRQYLENLKIQNISQLEFDRIIKIESFVGIVIIIELFREGNLIITRDGIIETVYRPKIWKNRTLKKGEKYVPPPQFKNPVEIDFEEFKNLLSDSDKFIVRDLAISMNFGKYAEELCFRAGIDKNKVSRSLNSDESNKLFAELKLLLEAPIFSCISKEFGASAIRLTSREILENFDTFNAAIYKIYSKPEEIETKEERIYKKQVQALAKMEVAEKQFRQKAEAVYQYYQDLNNALNILKKRMEHESLHEIAENPVPFKKLDPAKKTAVFELPENLELEIDLNLTLNQIAEKYYEEAKKQKDKITGLKNVLKKPTPKKEIKKIEIRKRTFWFEKYRWFISSDNALIVGGKDAKTNEEVVKKYLTEKDRYVHADIHGASSIVVKGDAPESTLVEACLFSLAFSKAWNAGHHTGDSYWVSYSQVSKIGESGEYVPKGAWMVRGKRNYFRNLKIELGIGLINYENTDMLMIGPVSAMEKHSKNYVVIEPGEEKKSDVVKKISKIFNVAEEEVMKLLPGSSARVVKII